ncbi:MAG: asparagine synthase (glutamine-hydrolyzing) [Candidatus Neomarinimicrobiota bacterium]
MCGIFGEFGFEVSNKAHFKEILSLSQSRGPDMDGYYSKDSVQFGFNRLSIIDTSKNGNQPILSPSGRYLILCNGEIVNYKKLAIASGIEDKDLRSASDIEVLAHLFDRWRFSKIIEELRGMYALAVYDNKLKELKLIRDPAGVKPLYCAKTKYGWLFASQYNQIFKHRWFKNTKTINSQALSDFLQLGYIPSPNAFYKNSWLIGPGEYYLIDNSFHHKVHSYYEMNSNRTLSETDPNTSKKLNDQLISILPDYANSDVPLGTFLSGGIDSPLITAIVSQKSPDIKAYSISSMHSGIDESIQARNISKFLKLDHHIEPFKPEYVSKWLNEHFLAYTEPFSDYSSLPSFILCKLASSRYKVMLGGDGGDENFWGYPRMLSTMDYKNWFQFPRLFRKIYAGILRRALNKRISSGIEIKTIGEWVFERQGPHYSSTVSKLMPDADYSPSTKALYISPPSNCQPHTLLRWLRFNEFYGHMQRRLLKMDRASMAHGLEVRLPLLDRSIIDFANNIKPSLGINHRNPKLLLKNCLNNYLPENLRLRQKQGFSINLTDLLRNELKQDLEDTLVGSKSIFESHINRNVVEKIVNGFIANKNEDSWSVWTLFSLYKFAELHIDK